MERLGFAGRKYFLKKGLPFKGALKFPFKNQAD